MYLAFIQHFFNRQTVHGETMSFFYKERFTHQMLLQKMFTLIMKLSRGYLSIIYSILVTLHFCFHSASKHIYRVMPNSVSAFMFLYMCNRMNTSWFTSPAIDTILSKQSNCQQSSCTIWIYSIEEQ